MTDAARASTPRRRRGKAVAAALRFPVRVAAIDVGSNAIRYVIAEFTEPTNYVTLVSERIAVRLGKDVFSKERRLSPESLEAAVAGLTQARRRMDDLGVTNYQAVATSAVRESRNGGEFVERVRRESGLHLETISGSQEARLIWKAVGTRIPFGNSRWLLVDLGGGSVEVSVVDKGGILWSESHTVGSVRLLQTFADEAEHDDDYRDLLERYVHVLKVPKAISEWRPVGTVATGGNIEALAKLAGATPNGSGIAVLRLKDLRALLAKLAGMSYEQRIEKFGLREDRADVIVPAAVVYERVAELAGAAEILVPGVGVKEGILLDVLDDLMDHESRATRMDHESLDAAIALGRRFQFDEGHARQVTELALSLFDQLEELHDLDEGHRRLLMVGALLHDVGQFVSYRRHHKHSWYLISNSELPDLSPEEVRQVALVARYHRRADPSPDHPEFQALSSDDREAVRRMTAILRVADAMDRGHVAAVAAVKARIEGREVILQLKQRVDMGLEEWALNRKGEMFEDVFGVSLRLKGASS